MFERGNAKDLRRVHPDLACRYDRLQLCSYQLPDSSLDSSLGGTRKIGNLQP
jgi:hypothetical protein